MPKKKTTRGDRTEDVSDLYKSTKNKKQRANKRHKEKDFMKDVKEIQDEGYDIDYIDNFEKF
jgi:hypothetical protein